MNRRFSIYATDIMLQRKKTLKDGESFSGLVSEVFSRYDLLMKLTDLPNLNENEIQILGEIFSDSELTPSRIKHSYEDVLYSEVGTEKDREELSKKMKDWSPVTVIKVLEEYF